MDELKWLQERLFLLSYENISRYEEEILSSQYVTSNESVINLSHNIILATQSQCLQLNLYVDLVIFLVLEIQKSSDSNFDNPISQLIPELISFCFKHSCLNNDFQPFLALNCFRYNQFYFLYLLFQRIFKINEDKNNKNPFLSIYDLDFLSNLIYEQYLKCNQHLPLEVLQMFLPEIEKNDKNLFFSLMLKKSNSQVDIETIIRIRDNFFCNSELLQSIQDDDVDKFQQLMVNIDLRKEIELWPFYPFRTTNQSFPLNMSAFFGSLKIFKFILLNCSANDNKAEIINDDLMRDAVLGRNIEIIRIIKQRFENQINEKLVMYSIATYRNEIVQWIIDDINNKIKLNSLIEVCLYSNNIEMLDSIIFSIPDEEKSLIFNNMKNVLALEYCASSGFTEIIQYLFENEFINSWKSKQKVYMNVLLKTAENVKIVEFVDYLYKNNIDEFNKYVMNYTELLIAAAKSGQDDMFNYAFKLFKIQKKRPKSNKNILGEAINGGNFEILKRCLKIFPNDINGMYKDLYSLLTLAIINHQKEIFDFLLTKEIDINQNFKGKTPLFYSLLYRRIEMTNELLNQPNVDINSNFPLMIAIKFGYIEIVKKICQNNQLKINEEFTSDGTPLLLAIEKKDIEMFKVLLSVEGIDINMSSPLQKAIETCSNEPEFQDLLFQNENIELNSDLLVSAIQSNNLRALKELNKRKVALPESIIISYCRSKEMLDEICQCQNFSPSMFNCSYLNDFIKNNYLDIVKFCLSFDDCDVNLDDPILTAIESGSEEIAVLLAKNPKVKVNENILNKAILSHFDECVEILLNRDDFEFSSSYKEGTPLFIAAADGTPKTIKMIIDKIKDKINVQEIQNTHISPEKDDQIQQILNETIQTQK